MSKHVKFFYVKLPGWFNKVSTLHSVMNNTTFTFVLEGINRLQSTLICECANSYVQQSQRYLNVVNDHWYDENRVNNLLDTYEQNKFCDRVYFEKQFMEIASLYKKMTDNGVPNEDARYILPLAALTNIQCTMDGWGFCALIRMMSTYHSIFSLNDDTNGTIGDELLDALAPDDESPYAHIRKYIEIQHSREYYPYIPGSVSEYIINKDDIVECHNSEANCNITNIARGALLSRTPGSPVDKVKDMPLDEQESLIERVLSLGHDAICEQATASFGINMSMSCYHQFIRHRLINTTRPELNKILFMCKHGSQYIKLTVPESIKEHGFLEQYINICNESVFLINRLMVEKKNQGLASLILMPNAVKIPVYVTGNLRAWNWIIRERCCKRAQWEIRDIVTKIFKWLYKEYPIMISPPPCCKEGGKCKEGKYSCGHPERTKEALGLV